MKFNYILAILCIFSITIINAQPAELIIPKPLPEYPTLKFSNDDKYLAVGGKGKVQLWDIVKNNFIVELSQDNSNASNILFSKCGKYLMQYDYSYGQPFDLLVWDIINLKLINRITLKKPIGCEPTFSNDGNFVYVFIDSDNMNSPDTLKIINVANGRIEKEYTTYNERYKIPHNQTIDLTNNLFVSTGIKADWSVNMPKSITLVNLLNRNEENIDWVLNDANNNDEFFQSATISNNGKYILLITTNFDRENHPYAKFRYYNINTKALEWDYTLNEQQYKITYSCSLGLALVKIEYNKEENHIVLLNSETKTILEKRVPFSESSFYNIYDLNNRDFLIAAHPASTPGHIKNSWFLYYFNTTQNSLKKLNTNDVEIDYYGYGIKTPKVGIKISTDLFKTYDLANGLNEESMDIHFDNNYTNPNITFSNNNKFVALTNSTQGITIFKLGKNEPFRSLKPNLSGINKCASTYVPWNKRYIFTSCEKNYSERDYLFWDSHTGRSIMNDLKSGIIDISLPSSFPFQLIDEFDYTNDLHNYVLKDTSGTNIILKFNSKYTISDEKCFFAKSNTLILGQVHLGDVISYLVFNLNNLTSKPKVIAINKEDVGTGSEKFSPDGNYFSYNIQKNGSILGDEYILFYDIITNTEIGQYKLTGFHDNVIIDPTYKRLLTTDSSFTWRYFDLRNFKTGKIIKTYKAEGNNVMLSYYSKPVFSNDGKSFALSSGIGNCSIYNSENGNLLININIGETGPVEVCFNNIGNNILISAPNVLKLFDVTTGKLLKDYYAIGHQYYQIQFNDNNHYFIVSELNSICTIFSVDSIQPVASFLADGEDKYICYTPDYYFTGSKSITQVLTFRKGLNSFSINQFEVIKNRPDIIAKRLGNTDAALITAYYNAYLKRIKKLGIDTTKFKDIFSAPDADFENRENYLPITTSNYTTLSFKAKDNIYPLERFNIWVNSSPLFGINGIRLNNRPKNTFDTTVVITLSPGKNIIEGSVLNTNATESFRLPLYINYDTPDSLGKTYFIGIGIDTFSSKTHSLKWCAKDIRDLSGIYKSKGAVILDTLFNQQVTAYNIKVLKQKLKKLTVKDKVIIAYSGHGLLSNNLDYYLSTWSVDFAKPENGGLPYDELESLFDSIPPRKKLLFIDACHSGEIDPDSKPAINNLAQNGKGGDLVETSVGLYNSFDLMQSLFANVSRNTGAVVISASQGKQTAGEGNGNGFFTAAILEAFKDNDHLTANGLMDYLSYRVAELSHNKQKPTFRNEPKEFDWKVW